MRLPSLMAQDAGCKMHDTGSAVSSPWDLPYGLHLYLHIPFCRSKCRYCDFVSYAGREGLLAPYVQALCREISWIGSQVPAGDRGARPTLYIGGGTPTVLPPAGLEEILRACAAVLDLDGAEITVEANPGTLSQEHVRLLCSWGVNRLSLGAQSFSPDALRLLGRIHSVAEADQSLAWARQAGRLQVNLDLIFGLPGQTLADWRRDLEEALAREPDHLSLYALSLEEGTPLAAAVLSGELPTPDEDTAAEMYLWAEERLSGAGYEHYEISNWAKPGCWSRHNIAYWRNEDYTGCGAAAHSHAGRRRWSNTAAVEDYIASLEKGRLPVAGEEEVDTPTAMGETMMLGLRLLAGVPSAVFAARYGVELTLVYGPVLEELVSQGLLEVDTAGARLTQRGRLLGNQVFARFLP